MSNDGRSESCSLSLPFGSDVALVSLLPRLRLRSRVGLLRLLIDILLMTFRNLVPTVLRGLGALRALSASCWGPPTGALQGTLDTGLGVSAKVESSELVRTIGSAWK